MLKDKPVTLHDRITRKSNKRAGNTTPNQRSKYGGIKSNFELEIEEDYVTYEPARTYYEESADDPIERS